MDPARLASEWFGYSYTIDYRSFADGDTRTVITHNAGPSATCYLRVKVWVGRREVWVEYHECDTQRSRDILTFEEFDPTADLWRYVHSGYRGGQ